MFSSVLICSHAQSNWGSGRIFAETKLVPAQGVCILAPRSSNCGVPKIREKSRPPLESKVVVHRDLDICPSRNLICSRSPPFFLHSFAQVRRRSWAPKCSIPICLDDCSTTDQTAQSLKLSRLTFPLFEMDRSSRPSSIPAAVLQALMPCLTQMGMATVRMRRPLPSRSARTQRPSQSGIQVHDAFPKSGIYLQLFIVL